MLLDKAVDLADRLLPAFDTVRALSSRSYSLLGATVRGPAHARAPQPSGLPMSFVNLAQRRGIPDVDNSGLTSVAEAGCVLPSPPLTPPRPSRAPSSSDLEHHRMRRTDEHEHSTLQLEFKYLSQLTGNPTYWHKVEKVMDVIRSQPSKDGLVPIFMRCVSRVLLRTPLPLRG